MRRSADGARGGVQPRRPDGRGPVRGGPRNPGVPLRRQAAHAGRGDQGQWRTVRDANRALEQPGGTLPFRSSWAKALSDGKIDVYAIQIPVLLACTSTRRCRSRFSLLTSASVRGRRRPSRRPKQRRRPRRPARTSCPAGHYGSPAAGCTDVNECASANGGCHKLAACKNTPGSRTCGNCPQDFQGDGYVGCFDVNECPNGDCTDRIPDRWRNGRATGRHDIRRRHRRGRLGSRCAGHFHRERHGPQGRHPPRVLPAPVGIDVRGRQDGRQLLGGKHPRQAGTHDAHGHGQPAGVLEVAGC